MTKFSRRDFILASLGAQDVDKHDYERGCGAAISPSSCRNFGRFTFGSQFERGNVGARQRQPVNILPNMAGLL
jgi:hypothetical protein